jgi:hypothetical protein
MKEGAGKKAVKFAARFGQSVQSVSVQQCGGLILSRDLAVLTKCHLFVPSWFPKHYTVRAEKLSQTFAIL